MLSTRPQLFLFVLNPNYFFILLLFILRGLVGYGMPLKKIKKESTNSLKVFWGLGSVASFYGK